MNGQPITLSPKQSEIFNLIVGVRHPRNQVIAPTQYGKSMVVGLAIDTRAVPLGERFTVLAPSQKKCDIIMGYCIDHIFDSPDLLSQLELDSSTSLDRLRRERSKESLTFKGGGGIQTLTLDAKNGKRSIESAMGFGSKRLILDESSLIDDQLYATVKRMLGGYKYEDQFLLEIGNPFHRNHFYRTWNSPIYNKIFLDYKDGLREGRYSPEFIEEMRGEAFFDVFYECKFPDEEDIDASGFRILVTYEMLDKAFSDQAEMSDDDPLILGVDVGGGGDANVYCLRNSDYAWIESSNHSNDTMTNVSEVERIMRDYGVKASNIFIDDTGIGRGVCDRLKEKGIRVNPVAFGASPKDKTRYANTKAEDFWHARQWLEAGGKLLKSDKWQQLNWIKYKVNTDKVLQIEPKDDLRKRTGKSPDFADSFALTFTQKLPAPNVRVLG